MPTTTEGFDGDFKRGAHTCGSTHVHTRHTYYTSRTKQIADHLRRGEKQSQINPLAFCTTL